MQLALRDGRGSLGLPPVRNASLFGALSLCLSRACLGKMMLFSLKWRKRCVFLPLDAGEAEVPVVIDLVLELLALAL